MLHVPSPKFHSHRTGALVLLRDLPRNVYPSCQFAVRPPHNLLPKAVDHRMDLPRNECCSYCARQLDSRWEQWGPELELFEVAVPSRPAQQQLQQEAGRSSLAPRGRKGSCLHGLTLIILAQIPLFGISQVNHIACVRICCVFFVQAVSGCSLIGYRLATCQNATC